MATYRNCYTLLGEVRRGLNEYSDGLHKGTSTSGKFSNAWLVERINNAQRFIYNLVLRSAPEEFRTSADVTVTDSVITLPWDFGTLLQLKNSDGYPVYPSNEKVLPVTGATGSKYLYYKGANNTLILNKSGVSDTYELWYTLKPRDMTQGQASSADTLASTAKAIADYYNNMIIEDITGDWTGTITDYSATRVITVSGQTMSTDDYYGIVSELPEPFHDLIGPLATMLAKTTHPASQEKPAPTEYQLWKMQLNAALDVYTARSGDISIEEIFTDFNTPAMGGGGVRIPGLDYLV